jgi:hypothetical protein
MLSWLILKSHAAWCNNMFTCLNHTRACLSHTCECGYDIRVWENHTLRVKITLCVWKSHSACRNHNRACRNHTRACENHNLRAEITLIRVEITLGVCFEKLSVLAKIHLKLDTHACEFHTQIFHFYTFACQIFSTRVCWFFRHAIY